MKDFHTLVFALLFVLSLIKMTHGQGKLFVSLDEYKEKDTTTKCIKICVTTSPSGFPRCNLNATTDTSITYFFGGYTSYPINPEHNFNFNQWEDNSELSITVWKNPSEQSCDTSAPTNNTYHGEGSVIIPRLEELKTRYIVRDKWKLKVRTKLICDNPGCIQPCVPRDNSTGHYSCVDNNKKCLENWFNVHENCTTFCDANSSTYKCTKYGSRICNPGYFGRDCDIFCDGNATNYKCDEKGRRTCFANWYNKNCEQFCDGSKGNYLCDNKGNRVCLLHWYGENCTKYCNNTTKENSWCSSDGNLLCKSNWFGNDCDTFCDTTSNTYNCSDDGELICLSNWYGEMCSVYCEENARIQRCENNGKKTCSRNWYGEDCAVFCNASSISYTCDQKGKRNCSPNWFGKNCSTFCNNSSKHHVCNNDGDEICLPDSKCASHCEKISSIKDLYLCKKIGNSMRCPHTWIKRHCSAKCIKDESKELQHALKQCKEKSDVFQLCSQTTKNNDANCTSDEDYDEESSLSSGILKPLLFGVIGGLSVIVLLLVIHVIRKKYLESHNNSPRVFELKSIKVKQSSESPLSIGITIHSGKVNPVCEGL